MGSEYIKLYRLEVEIQDNGIIRDPFGWIVGRCNDEWFNTVVRHEPPERTCRLKETTVGWSCSACKVVSWETEREPKPNYCPNCGAEVVE